MMISSRVRRIGRPPIRRVNQRFFGFEVPVSPERPQKRLSLDGITSYCKQYGFIYPGSDLYGSIGTGYDYGPLGTALKRNVQEAWWRDFISQRPDCVGIETTLLMNPKGD